MGAAIQGGLISGIDVGPVLVDITPHTLGIQAAGELHGLPSVHCFARIIERNTPLPATRSELFSTMVDQQEEALINVYQGESDDVRHNQCVGEFMLSGLAEVARGNEVLVRFHLNLDGILQVTAMERATGLQKQLIIDNAVSRFHARNLDAAGAELAPAGMPQPATGVSAAGAVIPADLAEPLAKSLSLIAQAQRFAPTASPEDQQEIQRLVEQLQAAVAARSLAEIHPIIAQLEDLVFYLQDT
jgi:molecular chaperone DnaK